MKITKIFLFLALAFLPLFGFASSDLQVANYKLNGKEENVRFNPSVSGGKVVIEINVNIPVKFNTIALCATGDSVCNRTTAVKYFMKTDVFTLSVSKEWDGKTSKDAIVTNGNYKIKVTMKDEAGEEINQELSPYEIIVDSAVLKVSSSSESKSSSVSSQSNLDDDLVVKKIRDFITNGGREPGGIATTTESNSVRKSSITQSEKVSSDNSGKLNAEKVKETKPKEEEFSSSTTQTAEVALNGDPSRLSFIWRILNLPFDGFNLIKRLFYSGN